MGWVVCSDAVVESCDVGIKRLLSAVEVTAAGYDFYC
ncbi:hypothetical protein Tco_1095447, partial [Tanacetum coccineum]